MCISSFVHKNDSSLVSKRNSLKRMPNVATVGMYEGHVVHLMCIDVLDTEQKEIIARLRYSLPFICFKATNLRGEGFVV